MGNDGIDFVVTWVDGSDPLWRKEKAKYSPGGGDVRAARFRDWDQLRYWFRAVEAYAPWVRRIHFLTFGHLPKWLNAGHPKLRLVHHGDFIPRECLPVFNSTAIEVHIGRIPGLAEQFVYFCDDMYLMRPCAPADFFRKGKPVDMMRLGPVSPDSGGREMYYHHLYNDYCVYHSYFSRGVLLRNLPKYVNLKYGKAALINAISLLAKNVYVHPFHFGIPLLKSSLDKIWEEHPDVMRRTAESRFRGYGDVNLQAIRGYQLITGNFVPARKSGIVCDTRDVRAAKEAIESRRFKNLCLSDMTADSEFEEAKLAINESFEKVFPAKSEFEI